MLLDLPTELLLEVIYCLDPGSFSQLFRVCKALRSAALGILPLQTQLDNVPGINDRLYTKDVKKLYEVFRRRASRNLLHGINALADVSRFTLPLESALKYGMFMNCSCKTDHLLMAVVRTSDASLGVYSIKSQIPILKCVLSPAALDLGPEEDIQFEVVKSAFYDSHERSKVCQCVDRLAVLYRYRLKDDGGGPFVRTAAKQSRELLKLVTWAFTEAFDASVEEIRDINTGGTLEPRAMAMADDGSALISYDVHPGGTLKSSGEWRIEWIQKRPNRFYDPFPLTRVCDTSCAASGTPAPAPSEIVIIKNRAWFFAPGIPTPLWEIDDYTSVSSDHMSPTRMSFATRPFTTATFGFPLAVHHKHRLVDPAGDEYCLNSVLQLHIHNEGPHPGAYIVKGVHFPNGCQHYNPLQRYHSVEHFIVAELGGLNLEAGASSSLGLIMAVSPRKRRVAIATWKRVQIWALHPNAFFERQTHSNGSLTTMSRSTSSSDSTGSSSGSSDATSVASQFVGTSGTNDNSDSGPVTAVAMHGSAPSVSSITTTASTDTSASNFSNEDFLDQEEWPWVDRCGWDYYSCFSRRDITEPHDTYSRSRSDLFYDPTEIVSLEPVELPSQGVVFALAFNGEDSLWAWTDHGPVKWSLDGASDARREEYELSWLVREMNVKS